MPRWIWRNQKRPPHTHTHGGRGTRVADAAVSVWKVAGGC